MSAEVKDALPPARPALADVLADLEKRGIDGRQLLGRLSMSPDERLRHLEEFVGDMRQLRRDVGRSRRPA